MRLLVVDDHRAVRLGLTAFLEAQDGIDVVGEGENGREAVELCASVNPDAVLMDIRMPVMDGIKATRLIKQVKPGTAVILCTAYEEDALVEAAREAGADRLVLKGSSGSELAAALREVTR